MKNPILAVIRIAARISRATAGVFAIRVTYFLGLLTGGLYKQIFVPHAPALVRVHSIKGGARPRQLRRDIQNIW